MAINQRIVKIIFNYLYNKKIFGFLISCFAIIAFGTWLYLSSAIKKNINFRLENELENVASTVSDNLNSYAGTLAYVQAYFRTEGVPNPNQFRKLAESIEVQRINYGLQGIGYIEIVSKNELHSFLTKNKDRPFFHPNFLKTENEQYAPITMVEPMNWRRSQLLGYNLFADKTAGPSIREVIKNSGIAMTPVIHSDLRGDPDPQDSVMLLSPFYDRIEIPSTQEARAKYAKGVIFIPVRLRDFFERTFGKPNSNDERINYTIEVINPESKAATLAYKRIDAPDEPNAIYKSRIIDVYGQQWKISVTPFPPFFNFGDLYLANTVAFASIIFIALLLSVFKQTQNLLEQEKKSKDAMKETVRLSRAQTAQLKRLNDINKATALELDLKNLIEDFFQASLQISHSSNAFLYCSSTTDHPEIVDFHAAIGFSKTELPKDYLTLSQLSTIFPQSLITKHEDMKKERFSKFLSGPDDFKDWIFITIPSREFKQCGLLFLGRKNKELYSENDLEIIESMVTQLGIGIDNSRLFKKVEDSNKVKTAFLANMSHEIRTPLNAITGYSEILGNTVEPRAKNFLLESIKKNSLQLTSIIDNILDISKVEFGRIYINKTRISLLSIIQEIQWVMEMRAKAKGISFAVEGINELPVIIETDESRVKQILINLIGNAIKFTDKGSVRLEVKCQRSADGTDSQLICTVIDTGIGIAKREQPGLFQSFSQADISSTRRFGGVGLGLVLSKRLAQQFGGDVNLLDSELTKGSIFELVIPCGDLNSVEWKMNLLKPIQHTVETVTNQSRKNLADKKILIVEDSEDNQAIFKYFLKSAGAISDVIDNGEDAVHLVDHSLYDFILMDIQLPKMDGREATRRIRAKGYTKPIIALTAHSSPEEKNNCLTAGCVALITKPVTQETLIKQILIILEENGHA